MDSLPHRLLILVNQKVQEKVQEKLDSSYKTARNIGMQQGEGISRKMAVRTSPMIRLQCSWNA